MAIFVLAIVLSLVASTFAACPTLQFQYGSNTFSGYINVDAATPVGFLMEAPNYTIPDACECGLLYKWHFFAVNAGTLQLQVWKRDTNTLYTLKGENHYTVPFSFRVYEVASDAASVYTERDLIWPYNARDASLAGQQIEFYIPYRDRITVRNNDLIGWYAVGSGVIGYAQSSPNYMDILKKSTSISDLNPGDTFGWQASTVTTLDNTIYAFGASVMANTAPAFTNLPRTMNIYSTWSANSYLYQVSVDDIDSDDVTTLAVTIDQDSTKYFNYSRTDKKLYLSRANIPVGTYAITFTVTDQCGNSNTGVYTVVVKNWPPSFSNLPNYTTFSEDVTNEIELYRIQFTDQNDDTLSDSVALTATPSTTNFEIKYYGTNLANRSIITKQGASYAYATSQYYKLTTTLTDGTTPTQAGYFLVYVTKNDPPKITNLLTGTHANVSYDTHRNDSYVFTVESTDAEHDGLSWSMTCLEPPSPAACPFYVDRVGVVYNTHDFIRTYEPGYDLSITVRDTKTTQAQTKVLTVFIQDINDKPVISNLPLTNPLVVYENTPLGTTLYTILYRDFDSADTHTVQATYDETWPRMYFNLNITTGILTTAHNILDYEELDVWTNVWTFTMNITVSDGYDWDSQNLIIKIGNINEAPSFHQTKYTLEPPETASVGASAGDPHMEVNDPDLRVGALSESHTYTWDCGNNSRYFLISSVGAITYSEDFNLDTSDAVFPYECVVTATDTGGLSATTTLQIEVQDTNNNAPIFPQTSTYLIIQDPFLSVGRFVGQVTANDIDSSEKYGKVYYSFLQVPVEFSESYLYINDLGNIYVNESWPTSLFDYGVTYELIVHAANAVDETGTRRTATATVSLLLPGTTTVYTTTTDRQPQFIEDNRNVAWVMGESALGAGLLILVFCLAMAYTIQTKRYRWCLPYFRKRFLGLKKWTQREKREYYRGILLEQMESSDEEASSSSSSSDTSEFSDDLPQLDPDAPPVWANMRDWVPKPAAYDEPRPPLKRDISGLSNAPPGPPLSQHE